MGGRGPWRLPAFLCCLAAVLLFAASTAAAATTGQPDTSYNQVGLVQQRADGRTYCQRDSSFALFGSAAIGASQQVPAVTPKRPIYGVCILQNTEWHKVALENLEAGHHYSIRLSYIALRTHIIDMFLETVLANGTSVFSSGSNFVSKVIVPYKRAAQGGPEKGKMGSQDAVANSAIQTAVEQDYGSLLGHDRELLDTSIKSLDPLAMGQGPGEKIEKMYLLLRITPKGLPSGELYSEHGVYTETERHESYVTQSPDARQSAGAGASAPFFQFDMVVAEKVSQTLTVDILPILLVCTTIFLLMNMYVLRRWQAYIASAPYASRNGSGRSSRRRRGSASSSRSRSRSRARHGAPPPPPVTTEQLNEP